MNAAAVVFAGMVVGAKAPLTPAGSPLTLSETAPVKPPPRVIVSDAEPLLPMLIETAELASVRVSVPWLFGSLPPPLQAAPASRAARDRRVARGVSRRGRRRSIGRTLESG